MPIIGYTLIGVIVVVGFFVVMSSRKKRWYKVYLANNEVMLLHRDLWERWWRTSDRYMRFKDEMGKEVTFPSEAHWILMWVEVPEAELIQAREEIAMLRQAREAG